MVPLSLIPLLPLLFTLAYAVLLPAPLVLTRHRVATLVVLASSLVSIVFSLLLIRLMSHQDQVNASRLLSATLVVLATGLALGPLLDRARPATLLITANLAGIFLVPFFFHGLLPRLPSIGGLGLFYGILIASATFGLGGSLQLPRHPERYLKGVRRIHPIENSRLCMGWVLLAALLLLLSYLMTAPDRALPLVPILVSGGVGALVGLLRGRPTYALVQAGQGFTAGLLIALPSALSLEIALAAGLVAGTLALYAEAIAQWLRLDDPHYLTASILLPACLGLLLPGLIGLQPFTLCAYWAGATFGIGAIAAIILWPLAKLTLGLADPILKHKHL
jgi:hypothetical protein